jgi:hypothetical protein
MKRPVFAMGAAFAFAVKAVVGKIQDGRNVEKCENASLRNLNCQFRFLK